MEDFEDLLYHFARQFRVRFSFAAVERLKEHAWPGNVRELRNVVARASAYFPGKHIGPDDLQAMIEPNADTTEVSNGSTATEIDAAGPAGFGGSVIKELEREMIIRRLVANQGNQRRTAHDLGIPKSTLHDRIRAYSIDLKTVTATGLDKID